MILLPVVVVSAVSAMATTALCLRAAPISQWLGIVDVPGHRKMHSRPTPLMGGIVLLLAVLPVVVVSAILGFAGLQLLTSLVWAGSVAGMSMLGLADDRHTLSPKDRLLVSFLVFGSATIMDTQLNVGWLSFEHPDLKFGFGIPGLAMIFTTLCCVGLVNAVNMADGKNGLVAGMCLGWLVLLGLRAPASLFPIVAIMAASLSVVLLFNLFGRLFLGDSGAYGVATAIGLLSIAIYNTPGSHAGRSISADELVVLFLVPVLDSFRLTYVGLREGRSPMSADRNHLHHYLQNWFGWPVGLVVYLFLALGPAAIVFVSGL